MSAREPSDESRRKFLPTVLFWSGVGLAPLAALLLLVGDGNGLLRIAAVLAVIAIVLIGLSITLRGDADSVRLEMEETLLEELDDLRGELRSEIATASRDTHKALGARLDEVQGAVEALRGQLEAVRAGRQPGGAGPGHGDAPAAAGARRGREEPPAGADAPPAATGQRRGGPSRGTEYGSGRGTEYGSSRGRPHPDGPRPGYDEDPGSRYDEDDHPDDRRAGPGRGRFERADPPPGADHGAAPGVYGRPGGRPGAYPGGGPGVYPGGAQWPPAGAAQHGATGSLPLLGPGVVQHTETVQVTTRHTIVGAAEEDLRTGNVYGGGTYGSGQGGGGAHGSAQPGGVYGGGRYGDGAPRGGDYGDGAPRGGTYGGGVYGGGRSDPPDDPDDEQPDEHAEEPDGRSSRKRRGGQPRGGAGGRRFAGMRIGDFRLGEMPWRHRSEPDPDLATGDPADDSYWSELRSGDRWSVARDDDQGQELRMGERRASMRADESGIQMRVEDRWAEVRRGEPWPGDEHDPRRRWPDADDEPDPVDPRGGGRWRGDEDDRRAGPWAGRERDSWDAPEPVERGPARRGGPAPALPPGGVDPADAWAPAGAEWGPPRRSAEPEPARWGRRHRDDEEYGYPPADGAHRAGGARRNADHGYHR